jgi:hypothetical protein
MAKLATMHELQTIYSLEDMHLLIEIITVDHYNRRMAQKAAERGR